MYNIDEKYKKLIITFHYQTIYYTYYEYFKSIKITIIINNYLGTYV